MDFDLAWWILIIVTVLCNIIWPPITLGVTLWWGVRSTNRTLAKAESIEKRVDQAIEEQKQKEKTEDILVAVLEDQMKGMKSVIDGKFGELDRKVDGKLDEAFKKIDQVGKSGSNNAGLLAGVGEVLASALVNR